MEILIIGSNAELEEVRQKFGPEHIYRVSVSRDAEKLFAKCDVVFDFTIEENTQVSHYQDYSSLIVFLNTAFITLSQLGISHSKNTDVGFCGLPTFLNREIFEVSLPPGGHVATLRKLRDDLKTDYRVVADRVGFVTPRVICMIINEAYYTVQEGTATREDIDKAMKLGTNYPFGPFEWAKRIGVKNVCKLLEAVYNDTHDQRYRICSMLMDESRAG